MAATLDVLRHGHVNQFAYDYDHVLKFYRDVFDAEVFMEFKEPDFGGANAVYLAGAACFEVFAPTDPDKAIGIVDSLEALFATSDHLVLAAPLTPDTRGIVSRDILRQAKPGLHLINIAFLGLFLW